MYFHETVLQQSETKSRGCNALGVSRFKTKFASSKGEVCLFPCNGASKAGRTK